LHPVERIAFQVAGYTVEIFGKSLFRLRIQVDENEPFSDFARYCGQAEFVFAQIEEILLVGHDAKRAGRVISPTMKFAGKVPAATTLFFPHQAIAAMGTHVMKCPDPVVLAADDQNRGFGDRQIMDEEVSRLGHVLDTADYQI
jgi:hypothetical protein